VAILVLAAGDAPDAKASAAARRAARAMDALEWSGTLRRPRKKVASLRRSTAAPQAG